MKHLCSLLVFCCTITMLFTTSCNKHSSRLVKFDCIYFDVHNKKQYKFKRELNEMHNAYLKDVEKESRANGR